MLVLVLVVVMMLSFAVYSFSSLMVAEYSATTTGLTHLQRRELATSGIELAAASIEKQRQSAASALGPLSLFQPVPFDLPNGQQTTISVLRDVPSHVNPAEFGLRDESAKLNLNTLPLELSRRKEARKRLTSLPGITIQIADAILDWMDSDDDVSEFGAETSFYTAQAPPRYPRQGRFESLNELLQVRGITAELLYGEDQNGNGLLDPEENDGDRTSPRDNADHLLQRGLSDYITLLSCETTLLPGGRSKINLNQPVLAQLFDQVESVLGTEAAVYIAAWRLRGATYSDEPRPDEGEDQERRRLERLESVRLRLEAQLGNVDGNRPSLSANQTQRAGLTLDTGSSQFKSLIELFGGEVRIAIDGTDTLLQSPWSSDPVTVRRMLPLFEQMMTTVDNPSLQGRININEASEAVLRSIPGITESTARAIVGIQREIRTAASGNDYSSVAWLVSRGLVSPAELRTIGPYVTTHGDVRSGIAIGQTAGHTSVAATRFLLDCSGPNRRILSLQDLPVTTHATFGLPPATK